MSSYRDGVETSENDSWSSRMARKLMVDARYTIGMGLKNTLQDDSFSLLGGGNLFIFR